MTVRKEIDLWGNEILVEEIPEKEKPEPAKETRPETVIPNRPYEIIRTSTTSVWCVNK